MNWNEFSYTNENLKYIEPFYNEKASEGNLTNNDCDIVVKVELDLVKECDLFIAYLDEMPPGSITELMYAASLEKEILIFYTEKDTGYYIKSEYWFHMIASKNIIKDKNKFKMIKMKRMFTTTFRLKYNL